MTTHTPNQKDGSLKPSVVLSKTFKKWRRKKKLSLRRVASLTGISNPYLSQFENHFTSISYDNAVILMELMRSRHD